MELLTIDLTGFDIFLYTLAIALPIIFRHPIQSKKVVTLEETQDLSYDDSPDDLTYLEPIAKLEVIPTTAKPLAIAPQSSITIHSLPDDQTLTDDLESLSVPQLKALCKQFGYTRYSKCSKHELILILRGQNKG